MKKNPLVSICIPTFNSSAHILRALESSMHQTYRDVEIVVVDNASTDTTRDIVLNYAKRDARIKFFRNETNIGSGNNFLKCFEHATGEFVQVLGADDWISKDCVERSVRHILLDPDAAAILPNVISLKSEQNNSFSFIDEWEVPSGRYSSDWFFNKISRGEIGGVGFISFMRRDEVANALRKVLANPVHILERGVRKEPMDMPIFLEVLAGHTHFIVEKEIAYIKTVHGKDQVGFQGDFFENQEGMIRYLTAVRRSYEFFFQEHGFGGYFRKLRLWSGCSMCVRVLRIQVQRWFKEQKDEKYRIALSNFFKDYSRQEQWLMFVSIPLYMVFKVVRRFFAYVLLRGYHFAPVESYFLTENLSFEI